MSRLALFGIGVEVADPVLVLRDVAERGRDVEGCIKQWFAFVKPNFERYVEPQRKVADIIVPRGIENKVAISKSSPASYAMLYTRICALGNTASIFTWR